MLEKYYDYKLCFIESSEYFGDEMKLYFTNKSLEEQWGDDWDDSPYEHNAGEPYEDEDDQILKIQINDPTYPQFITPRTHKDNSPFSVQDINNKIIPWLSIIFEDHRKHIQAGTTLKEVLDIFKEIDDEFEIAISYKLKDIIK